MLMMHINTPAWTSEFRDMSKWSVSLEEAFPGAWGTELQTQVGKMADIPHLGDVFVKLDDLLAFCLSLRIEVDNLLLYM